MQNVACPMTIVQIENGIPAKDEERVQRHAGDDPGERDRQEQQERDRLATEEPEAVMANAAVEPSRRAITVASRPHLSDRKSASRTSGSCHATVNQ